MNFWGRVYEGRMMDESNRLLTQARLAKEAAAPIMPKENELSPDAMTVDFSRVDQTLFASRIAIQNASETLDGWSSQA